MVAVNLLRPPENGRKSEREVSGQGMRNAPGIPSSQVASKGYQSLPFDILGIGGFRSPGTGGSLFLGFFHARAEKRNVFSFQEESGGTLEEVEEAKVRSEPLSSKAGLFPSPAPHVGSGFH